jgi:hypothetical protein
VVFWGKQGGVEGGGCYVLATPQLRDIPPGLSFGGGSLRWAGRPCLLVCVCVLRKGGRAAEGGGCIALHRLAEAFVLTA